jgi:hypothetical protein
VANSNSIILSSVGRNASNRLPDTKVIQSMLNFIDPKLGGPTTALRVDGMVGAKTVRAISAFQDRQLGFSDGVISPKGQTLKSLANAFAPSGSAAPKILTFPTLVKRSGWSIKTSGGFDFSLGALGGVAGRVVVNEDAKPTVDRKLNFAGAGLSVGPMPIGLDFSSVSAPGSGTRIVSPPGTKVPVSFADLAGPALIVSGGGSFALGGSASLVVFGVSISQFLAFQTGSFLLLGPAGISPLLPAILASKGVGVTFGGQAGIPNIGVSIYGVVVRAG